MRYTRLKKGEDISKLARRLFGTRSKAALRDAEEMLLKANPALRDPGAAVEGTPVLVPEAAGREVGTRAEGDLDIIGGLLTQARAELGDLNQIVSNRFDRQEEEAKAAQASLALPEVRKLAERSPEAKRLVGSIGERLKADLKEVEGLRKVQKEAFALLTKDLDEFSAPNPNPTDPDS
jgi:hypothetical protein